MGNIIDDSYFNSIVHEVKTKLPEYLVQMGRTIERNGTFRCVFPQNHKNNDETFSANMSENSDGTYLWYCHSCKIGGSIYDAVAELEGIPTTGKYFIMTTIDLANKFSIPIDLSKIYSVDNKEIQRHIERNEILKEIESIIHKYGDGITHLMSGEFGRKYSKETAEKICSIIPIGVVPTDVISPMIITKFGEEAMANIPFYNQSTRLLDSYVFSADSLVISARDSHQKSCGFIGRKSEKFLADTKEDSKKPKYKYTKDMISSMDMLFFGKSRKAIKNKSVVYIVEGIYDDISMYMKGIENTIPMLGSTFNDHIAEILSNLGVGSIIFICDNDKAGIKVVKSSLIISKKYGFTVQAIELPQDTDPDSYIQNHPEFPAPIDAIEFVIRYDDYVNSPDMPVGLRYQRMIEFVSNSCKLKVKMREYSKVIAEVTAYHSEDVFEDIVTCEGGGSTRGAKEMRAWNTLHNAKELPITDKIIAIENTKDKLIGLLDSENDTIYQHTWATFVNLLKHEIPLPSIIPTGFPSLDNSAEIEAGTLAIWSAFPSNCKSSLLRASLCQMFRTNPDLFVLYVSTDDPPVTAMIHLIAILTGMYKSEIKSYISSKELMNRPEMARHADEIKDIFMNRLCLVGLEECRSVNDIRKKAIILRKKYANDFVIVVDAMNNLEDMRGNDQRLAIESIIGSFKAMAVHHNAAVSVVSHMTKQEGTEGNRPSSRKLKGSSYIEYEAKNVFLLHMDMKYNEETGIYWRDNSGEKLPIVEVNVAKDKDNKANNSVIVPILMNPYNGQMMEPPNSKETMRINEAIKLSINSKQRKGEYGETFNGSML